MAEKSLGKDARRIKKGLKILEGNQLAGLIGASNYQKLMRAYKNRHVQKREDPNNKGKVIQFDTLLDRPVTETDITKSLIKQMTGTETPGADLKYIGLKQREHIQRNIGRLGEGVTPSGLTIDDVFANTRRFFSPNLYNEKGEKIGKQIDVRREAVADKTARQALTAQGQSSYATPEQQQYLKNDERVPQSGLATDYLEGLGVNIDFTNKNKLNINPGFRPEVTDNPAVQKLAGEYKGLDDLTIQKADVNDKAPIEKAINNSNDYEREVARDLNPNEVRTWSTDGGKETIYKDFKEFDEKDASGGKAKWLADTANSPAAKAGLSDDQRWAARQNHLKWLKDKKNKKKLAITSPMDMD